VSDQLGRLSYLFGLHYQSEDCFLHQANHRARFFGRRWLRDAAALPLVKEEGALKAIIYPLHIHRTFESRWATRVAAAKPRRSRSEDTDTCECGNVVGVPRDSSNSRSADINQWPSAACGSYWETAPDLSKPSGRRFECQK
jgi:hypothetical protein